MNTEKELGATGKFPEGKLDSTDDGELKIGVTTHNGKVIIDFGPKPVKWIGMKPEQAIALGEGLIRRAKELQ